MSKASIGIIGAGQSGLLLGVGLHKSNFDVTVYSAETPEERWNGRISSTQAMSHVSRDIEREIGLNFWEDELPPIYGFVFRLRTPDGHWFTFEGDLERPAESVDQRVKFSRWMEHFKDLGGNLVFKEVEREDLPDLEENHDFVIVTTGKGHLGKMFERDAEHSPYDQPMRNIGLVQFRGADPGARKVHPNRVCFTILAGLGECFPMPVLTTTNGEKSWTYVHEAIPGSEMDVFQNLDWANNPQEMLDRIEDFWKEYVPFFYESAQTADFRLTDQKATLQGAFPPTVRNPVTTLPNGTMAMAVGDAAETNDPVTGQGSNNATRHAWTAFQMIKDHNGPWDEDFARAVWDEHFKYGKEVARWTNMLLGKPPEHVIKLFAAESNAIGDEISKGWVDAPYFDPWLYDADEAEKLIAEKTGQEE